MLHLNGLLWVIVKIGPKVQSRPAVGNKKLSTKSEILANYILFNVCNYIRIMVRKKTSDDPHMISL